jgi:hypothetical protein
VKNKPDRMTVTPAEAGRWQVSLLAVNGEVLKAALLNDNFQPTELPYEGPTDFFLKRGQNWVRWTMAAWSVSNDDSEWAEIDGAPGWAVHVVEIAPVR